MSNYLPEIRFYLILFQLCEKRNIGERKKMNFVNFFPNFFQPFQGTVGYGG